MRPRVHPIGRAIAATTIVLALMTPTAFAQKAPNAEAKPGSAQPAGQEKKAGDEKPKETDKPAPASKPSEAGKPAPAESKPAPAAKPAETVKPAPATTSGNTQGKSSSNPDGGGVDKPYAADGQPAGSQGNTVNPDGNNGCGQEKKAGAAPDPQGGYDDNNGNCGGKPKGPGQLVPVKKVDDAIVAGGSQNAPGCAFGNDQKNGQNMTAPGCGKTDDVKVDSTRTTSTASTASVASVLDLMTAPAATTPGAQVVSIAPVVRSDMPVAAVVAAPVTVTLANGTVVPLPLGTAITVPLSVEVTVLSPSTAAALSTGPIMATRASAPASAVLGVSVSIPTGTVVIANGLGAVTVNEPLEVVLGEQVVRAPGLAMAVLPTSLPRTGGLGGLTGLLTVAMGIAAAAGGAYLRRRSSSPSV